MYSWAWKNGIEQADVSGEIAVFCKMILQVIVVHKYDHIFKLVSI